MKITAKDVEEFIKIEKIITALFPEECHRNCVERADINGVHLTKGAGTEKAKFPQNFCLTDLSVRSEPELKVTHFCFDGYVPAHCIQQATDEFYSINYYSFTADAEKFKMNHIGTNCNERKM